MKPPVVVKDEERGGSGGAGDGAAASETVTAEVDPEALTRPAGGAAAAASPRPARSPRLTGRSMELGPTLTADGSFESGAVGDGGLAQPPPSRLPAPLQTRDRERYDVLGEHGRGGLGTVARAYDKELGRQVAIKELLRRGFGEVRFLREALITARLEHPGIVPIHEAGRWPDGTPFYVMKLVSGRSLKELIEERQTVEERIQLLHHVIAVADAMAYAHKRKIIHRDLKPSNVIAGDFGETVVIDWGLAKDLSAADDPEAAAQVPYRMPLQADLTETGSVLGTPMYMPPEQWRGEAVDQRADVFAIGAMLWELCSLQRVPPTEPRLRDRLLARANIDADLAAIVAKSLDPDPARRYRDAGELADDLKAFKSGARIAARSYSPFAVIAHWTRRHHALAATIAAALVLALAGSILYVRNIAVERDRADAARAVANTERDNARLSEATALLDKDPTRARDLLASMPAQTPRHALLRSRANHGAATHVIPVAKGVRRLRHNPTTSSVAVITLAGQLALVDIQSGELKIADEGLHGSIAWRDDHWIYTRQAPGSSAITMAATTTPQQTISVGSLLAASTTRLLSALGRTYALESGSLYVLDQDGASLLSHGIRSISGNADLLLICTDGNELEVKRGQTTELRSRCAKTTSHWPMAVAGGDYAALLDPSTLLLVRSGTTLQLAIPHIEGEYEIALSTSGLLALADFSGKTWFVRPGSSTLEPGPTHTSRPTSVSAAGKIAAWGYTDGTVIAIDAGADIIWRFVGHSAAAQYLAVDERHNKIVSAGSDEVRLWTLRSGPLTRIRRMPGIVFNAAASPDNQRILLDCDDGSVHTWTPSTNEVQQVHRHENLAYGVAWLEGAACSGGLDRRVLCTTPDGETREIASDITNIRALKSSPDHRQLVVTSQDGRIREFDGSLRVLYSHEADPFDVAFSKDGRWLATGASSGEVIVWDRSKRQISSRTQAHAKRVVSLAWRDDELWTTGGDGAVKRWRNEAGGLSELDVHHEHESARMFRFLDHGWTATENLKGLFIRRPASGVLVRFDLGRRIEGVEASPDKRYIAASSSGEIVVIDSVESKLSAFPFSTNGAGYIGFTDRDTLVLSNPEGLFTVSVKELPFERFSTEP